MLVYRFCISFIMTLFKIYFQKNRKVRLSFFYGKIDSFEAPSQRKWVLFESLTSCCCSCWLFRFRFTDLASFVKLRSFSLNELIESKWISSSFSICCSKVCLMDELESELSRYLLTSSTSPRSSVLMTGSEVDGTLGKAITAGGRFIDRLDERDSDAWFILSVMSVLVCCALLGSCCLLTLAELADFMWIIGPLCSIINWPVLSLFQTRSDRFVVWRLGNADVSASMNLCSGMLEIGWELVLVAVGCAAFVLLSFAHMCCWLLCCCFCCCLLMFDDFWSSLLRIAFRDWVLLDFFICW